MEPADRDGGVEFMQNFLKIVLILLLLASAAALWFGVRLFPQREELKGRTQKLETAVRQIAATVEQSDDNPAFVVIAEDQLKAFKNPAGGPAPMDAPLNQLTVAAQNQLARLNDTRRVLGETKDTLAQTTEDLRATKSDLAAARTTIQERDESITGLQASVAERDNTIRAMERSEKELNGRVDTLKVAIDDLEIQKRNLQDQIAGLQQKVTDLEVRANPEASKAQLSQGQLGVVLFANPEWNFVVLGFDKDNMTPIAPKLEFLVHRADQLVGKVRVESVVENMAIAEILVDWQKLAPREGDNIML